MPALVVTRKPGQEIVVDGPARIVICESSPTRVKVRIEADQSVTILRGELVDQEERPCPIAR